MGNARRRKIPAQLVDDEDYQLRHERVAGVDIAKAKADVCTRLPPPREGGRRRSRVEEVPATARDILDLGARLLADRVELVVMESTSDYWRIWYYLLESLGLAVQLVNASQARQLAGRPKTDRLDCQWIARLAEMGLLRPSFVPPPEIRALRDLTRTRLQLVRDRTREWQRLEKLLEGALIKLSSVVSSLAAAKSAHKILAAIAGGQTSPQALAALAHGNVKGGRAAVERALEGMRPEAHHLMLIRLHLDRIKDLDRRAAALEDEAGAALDAIPAARVTADGEPAPGPAALSAAERLAEIPGVTPELAIAVIAETGLDMTRFPTAEHLASWAGLAPAARQSGPRTRKPKKGPGQRLPQGLLHPGRPRRRQHRHVPRRALPPPRQAHRRRPRPVRRRPLRPHHHLAPAIRPRGQVHRPRTRLAHPQTATARSAPTSASSKPSASTSPSPPPPPEPKPKDQNKNDADQARYPRCHGPLKHVRVWLGILTVTRFL